LQWLILSGTPNRGHCKGIASFQGIKRRLYQKSDEKVYIDDYTTIPPDECGTRRKRIVSRAKSTCSISTTSFSVEREILHGKSLLQLSMKSCCLIFIQQESYQIEDHFKLVVRNGVK
jgi:hypothetical protein